MSQMLLEQELKSNAYPRRGIVIRRSEDGAKAVTAYFIMSRSANNCNHIFAEDGEGIRTQAFDPAELEDPSLIIHTPIQAPGNKTIVTDGDRTGIIYNEIDRQMIFEQPLRYREFEPDVSNCTPWISGIMHTENGSYNYAMSILKSNNGNPDSYLRFTYAYQSPVAGEGRFIYTCMHSGNPLPNFEGEPKKVEISGNTDTFTDLVRSSLNEDDKVSLFVCSIDITAGTYETRITSKNK